MYFASIASMNQHPGNKEKKLTLSECATIADNMMMETLDRFPEDDKWPGLARQ